MDYFKKCKISAVALIKMAMHARSGGDIEVMGNLQGHVIGDTFYIMDSYNLPTEASETRVSSTDETTEYMVAHQDYQAKVHSEEGLIGWYHSHPGYGCWLSKIDIHTTRSQMIMCDPIVAIVVDPKLSLVTGKVEFGAFRAYSEANYNKRIAEGAKINKKAEVNFDVAKDEKLLEFGMFGDQYYKLETSIFKTKTDSMMLDRIWNQYWVQTLASSSTLLNSDKLNHSIMVAADKL